VTGFDIFPLHDRPVAVTGTTSGEVGLLDLVTGRLLGSPLGTGSPVHAVRVLPGSPLAVAIATDTSLGVVRLEPGMITVSRS
jgi:streptogramin lyase